VGSRYLQFFQSQNSGGLKSRQDFFAEIVDQPYFNGKDWVNKKFIILPVGVDGVLSGAIKSNSRTCHIQFQEDGSSVKICDVSGVIEYGVFLKIITMKSNAS
jgi:hypothetical protein